MRCKSVQIKSPRVYVFEEVDIGDPGSDELLVEVAFSSVCHTDSQIFSGSLSYYRDGRANYPIITGHEWCGIADGQPVVGLCILGCGDCEHCESGSPIWCDNRREVGVVNKDGAHANSVIMPSHALLPIPKLAPKFALVEPMAVVVHALHKIRLHDRDILISGYGSIGKLCGEYLRQLECSFEVCDPRLDSTTPKAYDLVLECSGAPDSLVPYLSRRGIDVVLFGFEYNSVQPGLLVSNEISLLTTLGSTEEDFKEAIAVLDRSNFNSFIVRNFEDFSGYYYTDKTVFDHRSYQ